MTTTAGSDEVRMLLIDNYDSFTYNLVQAFAALGADVIVHRNDAISVDEALQLEPTHLVISPGPGRPEDAGVSIEMIAAFAERVPLLGVCLGHQCLVKHFGELKFSAAARRTYRDFLGLEPSSSLPGCPAMRNPRRSFVIETR